MSDTRSLNIRIRHMEHSNDLLGIIERESESLLRRHPQVLNCGVVIEKRSRRHRTGNPVQAQVSLTLPGKVLVASKRSEDPDEFEGTCSAVHLAFDAAERSLVAYKRRLAVRHHGHHKVQPVARVV